MICKNTNRFTSIQVKFYLISQSYKRTYFTTTISFENYSILHINLGNVFIKQLKFNTEPSLTWGYQFGLASKEVIFFKKW